MRKFTLTLLASLTLCVVASADGDKPQLPKVPAGFDEGRSALAEEISEGLVPPEALIERLFEHADAQDLSVFIHRHMLSEETVALDAELELDGKLSAQRDATGLQKLFAEQKIKPATVVKAIGAILVAQKFSLTDVTAWLYARGYNYRILQRALNGERLDGFRVRAWLHALGEGDDPKAVTTGLWEYNLDDGREEKGGHYKGVQLTQFLLRMGWSAGDLQKLVTAEGGKKFTEGDRKLVAWGDPILVWGLLEPALPESNLYKAIRKHYAANPDPKLVAECLQRAEANQRWFRTGGAGVRAVYRGPWPDNKGVPRPPTQEVLSIGDVDGTQFANSLTDEILAHFADGGDTLTLVVYKDGSARAILDKPNRNPVTYRADHPFGKSVSTRQAYEGRVSVAGHNALMYLVYSKPDEAAPEEFEFVNVKLAAGESFMVAEIDDGLNLTPILLKRINPLDE